MNLTNPRGSRMRLLLGVLFSVLASVFGNRHVRLDRTQASNLWRLFVRRSATLHFDIRQDDQTEAVLFSVYRQDSSVLLFHISTSTVTNKINLRIRASGQRLRTYSISAPLNDGQFHRLTLSLNRNELTLIDNCQQLLKTEDHHLDLRHENVEVYVGREKDGSSRLHGTIREFTADEYSSADLKCPNLEIMDNSVTVDFEEDNSDDAEAVRDSNHVADPIEHNSVSADRRSIDPAVGGASRIEERVDFLENQFQHWRSVIKDMEDRVKRVELHQRGCQMGGGRLLSFGEKQQNLMNCSECQCSSTGELHCGPIGCPHLSCQHPVQRHGKCCPECGKSCYYNGNHYENGVQFWPKACVHCICIEGKMECQYKQAGTCPRLDCAEQEIPPSQCCPRCVNVDHCAAGLNPCHANADCESAQYSAKCSCKNGYFGNGTLCYDIDECLWDESAREQLGGCQMGTLCINLPGSFKCDCLPGFRRLDDRNCLDVIRV